MTTAEFVDRMERTVAARGGMTETNQRAMKRFLHEFPIDVCADDDELESDELALVWILAGCPKEDQ